MCDFFDSLSMVLSEDQITNLNFSNNTVDELNDWINGNDRLINLSVPHEHSQS